MSSETKFMKQKRRTYEDVEREARAEEAKREEAKMQMI